MRIYLAAIALLIAWDTAATHLGVNVWDVATEGNPLMVSVVAAGWWAIALVKIVGFLPFVFAVRVALKQRLPIGRFSIRFLFLVYAVLGFWHCYVLSLSL